MRNRRLLLRAACCVLLLLAACEREKPPEPDPGPINPYTVDYDADNLLNLAHGASVVSRTAEFTLESSAVHAIDGDWLTFWKSPPSGAEQTFVFSLSARARIDRLGVVTSDLAAETPQKLRFEASDDGVSWRDAATIDVKPVTGPQTVNVKPFEATYLRVHTIEPAESSSVIRSVLAFGRELAPVTRARVDGCWTINGLPARLTQRGSSVAGVIGSNPPIQVTGGYDGRTLRVMWLRNQMWGRAILTFDPGRGALSGVRWFEDVIDYKRTDSWFGAPAQCGNVSVDETAIANALLSRARKWSMYGDDALDTAAALIASASSQRFRVVARDQARLNAVRDALKSRGADLSRVDFAVEPKETFNEPQRVIADGVELHLR